MTVKKICKRFEDLRQFKIYIAYILLAFNLKYLIEVEI